MLNPKNINAIVKNVMDSLPEGIKNLPNDMEQEVKSAMTAALQKMDVVTREAFDVQAGVLARTREKLEALEKRVNELEAKDHHE